MADDSVEKPTEDQPEKIPVTSITHVTAKGHITRPIDPVTHKFVKKPTRKASTEEVAKVQRDFLNARLQIGPDGKPTKATLTRYMQMVDVLHEHVMASRGTGDAKMVMAAQSCFKTLAERAYGPARDVDVETSTSGVRIVVITSPALPDGGELKPREELKPSFEAPFIEGEIVS